MAPIIVDRTTIFAVRGQVYDRPWANVWAVKINEGRPAAEASIQQTAEDFLDHYATYFASMQGAAVTIVDCAWVDIDSLNGSKGSVNDTPTKTFPFVGVKGADAVSGNVAGLITKNTTGGRSARNGRCFMPGLDETDVDANKLTIAAKNTLQTNMNNFLAAMQTDVGGFTRQLGVVHRPATSAPSFTPIVSLGVQERLATLRRRLRA